MGLYEQMEAFSPLNEQEACDREEILRWLKSGLPVFSRECTAAHLTASAWVVSPDRKQVLMAYHNLYKSWAWLGGHADGEQNLLAVAKKEVMEESGLKEVRVLTPDIFSIEVLCVDGHVKRGKYVSSHLHLNVTYLLEADPDSPVFVKPDENSAVGWIPVEKLPEKVSEPWFLEHIYSKLCKKVSEACI